MTSHACDAIDGWCYGDMAGIGKKSQFIIGYKTFMSMIYCLPTYKVNPFSFFPDSLEVSVSFWLQDMPHNANEAVYGCCLAWRVKRIKVELLGHFLGHCKVRLEVKLCVWIWPLALLAPSDLIYGVNGLWRLWLLVEQPTTLCYIALKALPPCRSPTIFFESYCLGFQLGFCSFEVSL